MLTLINQIQSYLQEYGSTAVVVVLVFLSFVEIIPIKVNPWTAIGKCISKFLSFLGGKLLGDYLEKLDKIDSKVDLLSDVIDENEIDRIRWEILTFSNSCQRGTNHTQNDFQHIFKINKKYHDILDRIDQENGEIDREMEYVETLYAQKKEDNSFLP